MEDAEQLANSTGKILSTHEWSHSRAWMGLCVPWARCGASLKIRVNAPMRVRLKIRHGDMWAQPRYELLSPVPDTPPPEKFYKKKYIKKKAKAKKQFVYLMQEPWCVVPDCFHLHLLPGSQPFTQQTIHKHFKQGKAIKPHAFHPSITTWCKPFSPDFQPQHQWVIIWTERALVKFAAGCLLCTNWFWVAEDVRSDSGRCLKNIYYASLSTWPRKSTAWIKKGDIKFNWPQHVVQNKLWFDYDVLPMILLHNLISSIVITWST